jgi:hypothetical protein
VDGQTELPTTYNGNSKILQLERDLDRVFWALTSLEAHTESLLLTELTEDVNAVLLWIATYMDMLSRLSTQSQPRKARRLNRFITPF